MNAPRAVWVAAYPSEVRGQWVGDCPEFGVVSMGNNVDHSLAMVQEALGFVLADDLASGADPDDRRAPTEEWAELERVFAANSPRAPDHTSAARCLIVGADGSVSRSSTGDLGA